ncbi:tyrosine-type recombinase/integrase [Rhodopirellula baltica]|uniref:Integrase n=1 Tax=Rhodopirellula baltica SWK14 TaxID=993516 RepID=L7CLN7_RHOBT|nr:tyrosine-type recombinase/integrase [Rhodopirellula baltica]ELP35214.1 Integrase [Rhodopirellula baltica SWK14]
MASMDRKKQKNSTFWRIRYLIDKKRKTLYFPDMSKRNAAAVLRHVEELVEARRLGSSPPAATLVWASSLDATIHDKLFEAGLLGQSKSQTFSACTHLGEFVDAYMEHRTDLAVNSWENYDQTRKMLKLFFGEKHMLRSVTAADAMRFRNWLSVRVVKEGKDGAPDKLMADATLSKHIKRAKTMFQAAADDNVFAENPFGGQKGLSEANRERFFFVTKEMYRKVLAACPSYEWKLILALPRLAGMRCPSEVTALMWDDIDWQENKIHIKAKKTKARVCPLFPELRPLMLEAMEQSESAYCVGHHHTATNLSTHLHRIIRKAGLQPWEKTFVNLRSTRRTELQDAFPGHVIDAWLGQSERVANEHYLQVTSGHWDAGVSFDESEGDRSD